MGILDDAIREHLDLKRKHGARDAELREIEDEALGSGEQPDPFAAGELFNDAAASEAAAEATGSSTATPPPPGPATPPPDLGDPSAGGEEPTRLVEPSEPVSPPEGLVRARDLDEPTPLPESKDEPIPGQERFEEPIPGQEQLPEPEPQEESYMPPPPPPEEPPSDEIEPPAPSDEVEAPAPSDEVEAPAPSESLEELIAEEEPFPEDDEAPEPGAPPEPLRTEDHLEPPPAAEVEEAEPGLESSTPDPPPPPPPGSEPPGRARGRVDVPTQEHPPPGETGGLPSLPPEESEALAPEDDAPEAGGPRLYDFETDEDPLDAGVRADDTEDAPVVPADDTDDVPVVPAGDTDDDFQALGPAEEEASYVEEEEPYADEPVSDGEPLRGETDEGPALDAEESGEEGEDDLWFEKGPPQDFDFEDEDR